MSWTRLCWVALLWMGLNPQYFQGGHWYHIFHFSFNFPLMCLETTLWEQQQVIAVLTETTLWEQRWPWASMCKVLMVVTCQVNSLPHDAVVYQNNTEPKCFVFISPMPYFSNFKENTEITEKTAQQTQTSPVCQCAHESARALKILSCMWLCVHANVYTHVMAKYFIGTNKAHPFISIAPKWNEDCSGVIHLGKKHLFGHSSIHPPFYGGPLPHFNRWAG